MSEELESAQHTCADCDIEIPEGNHRCEVCDDEYTTCDLCDDEIRRDEVIRLSYSARIWYRGGRRDVSNLCDSCGSEHTIEFRIFRWNK